MQAYKERKMKHGLVTRNSVKDVQDIMIMVKRSYDGCKDGGSQGWKEHCQDFKRQGDIKHKTKVESD